MYREIASQINHIGIHGTQRFTLTIAKVSKHPGSFRGLLALALKEKYLLENINEHLDKIDTQDTRKEFLTIEEVQALYNTPCREPVLKAASLFLCLTGLRLSDILALKWENFEAYPDGGHCIRLRTEKTDAEALNPSSQEAYELCGEKSTGLVFKGFKKTMLQNILPQWLQATGITKHITFHVARHTFATTISLSNGVPIESVSKMLGHTSIKTTQIYARILNSKISSDMDMLEENLKNMKTKFTGNLGTS